jgi:predicted enzyme related to lactoylglutathione lyase
MARVLGVGGVFFRAGDPGKLGAWYQEWLEVPLQPHGSALFTPDSMPESGGTAWSPFANDTEYFGSTQQQYMVNLVVDDLDEALAQVQEGGAELAGEIAEYDYGRFGWFIDPEGNKVELWEPRPMAS